MSSVDGAIGAETVPRRRLDSRVRALRDRTLVAGPQEALELDGIATFIWQQIDGTRTIRQVAEAVAAEYDVAVETAVADVAELVGQLVDCQVAELAPRST